MGTMAMMLIEVGEELGVALSGTEAVKRRTFHEGSLDTLSLEMLSVLLPQYVEVAVEGPGLRGHQLDDLLVGRQSLLRPWPRGLNFRCRLYLSYGH